MSKLFYSVVVSIAVLIIIAFSIISYIDRTMLDTSKTPSAHSTTDATGQLSKESYHLLTKKRGQPLQYHPCAGNSHRINRSPLRPSI